MSIPPIRYVRGGGGHIAYRSVGTSDQDHTIVLPTLGTIELLAEPPARRMVEDFCKHSRVISFDRRGAGLSDPLQGPAPLEEQMEDVIAVLDACNSDTTVISAEAEGAMLAVMVAATYPERVSHLVLLHPMARVTAAPGYEWTWESREARMRDFVQPMLARWGTGDNASQVSSYLAGRDPDFVRWWGRWERLSASPGTMEERMDLIARLDVREILPQVQAPTLRPRQAGREDDGLAPRSLLRRAHSGGRAA